MAIGNILAPKVAPADPTREWCHYIVIEQIQSRHGVRLFLRDAGERWTDGDRPLAVLMTKCRDQGRCVIAD